MVETLRRRTLPAALAVAVALVAATGSTGTEAAPPPLPPAHEFVAIADREVCSLVPPDGSSARVYGQDGSASVVAGSRVFWSFGDTYVGSSSGAPNQPNGLGYAPLPAVDPAIDCLAMQRKRTATNTAIPLLAQDSGECSVWPTGMTAPAAPTVHFFYVSVPVCGGSPAGVGLGSFDGATEPSFPSQRHGIVWPDAVDTIDGVHPLTDGPADGYIYLALHGPTPDTSAMPFASSLRLARVPASATSLQSCVPYTFATCNIEYWNSATSAWNGTPASPPVITPELGMNGGVTLSHNAALGKWMATYATGPLLTVRARTAASITGAWSAEETLLSYCPYFFLPGFGYCYTGATHPEYDIAGDNTIYVTMSTSRIIDGQIEDYAVYLHEITLGRPVVQSVNGDERRYRIGAPPDGYTPEGTAFYASAVPLPGFAPIYEWSAPSGDVLLAPAQPDGEHTQQGALAFHAPLHRSVAPYAHVYEPVYRWERGGERAYSALTTLADDGFANVGVAFYTVCGDADADYLSDCAEINSGNDPHDADYNVDGDVLLDDEGNPVLNFFGLPIPLGNAASIAQDSGARRQDIDNCPLHDNPLQENTDAAPLDNGPMLAGDDVTAPFGDVLGDACDPDADNDGILDAVEAVFPVAGCPSASAPLDPTKMDTDGDGLRDGWECDNGSDPADASSRALGGAFVDADGDRVNDVWEARGYGHAMHGLDADGDGCADLVEIASVDGNHAVTVGDALAVARRQLGIWAPHPAQDYVLDVNRNGFVDVADRLFVARAAFVAEWQPKFCL
jgi:hypothetical protein